MRLFSPSAALILVAAAVVAGLAFGFLAVRYDEGQLSVRLGRRRPHSLAFDFRDTWFLLLAVVVLGWSVATAVDRYGWVAVPDKLVPAMLIATALAWLLSLTRLPRSIFLLLAIPGVMLPLGILAADQFNGRLSSLQALGPWLWAGIQRPQLALLLGLLTLMLLTGFWTSWWVFRRRRGLYALLPSGIILAVEILNDSSPGLYFFTLSWLACAAAILLRLHFVSLKQGWRTRRIPRAADTGWTFGEVGFEATAILLVVAFLLPPLSNVDISSAFLPGTIHTDQFHPFGFDFGKSTGLAPTVGYSETIRPGTQLRVKSSAIMVVSGDSSPLYPYFRGIALGGWDGISWYPLPSTPDLPVREQPRLEVLQELPRDDLPQDPHRLLFVHNTFQMLVPPERTKNTVFSAGEIVWVDNHVTSVHGIMTAQLSTFFDNLVNPELVNQSGAPVPFDTVDVVRMVDNPRAPYQYSLYAAIPKADTKSLQQASTDYPSWIQPYQQLYYQGRVAASYSTEGDGRANNLAVDIVQKAHASNPYDEAKAIETYLRDKSRFTYTLTPPPAPAGARPIDYFLFQSYKGFCQDFSTAMAVLLRSLGIPARQMSGFSQGIYDEKAHRYLINALDAHSWVEVFFPGYGWIPFEPTPDPVNGPIARPATLADVNVPLPVTVNAATRNRAEAKQLDLNQGGGTAGASQFPNLWSRLFWLGIALVLLAVLGILAMVRWLMSANDARRIWRRLQFLADRLHVPRQPGDTPNEFGARLAEALPSFQTEVHSLAHLYTRANYRRGGLSQGEMSDFRRSWHSVRRHYPALVARAWREGRRWGLRSAGAELSRNRERARRR